MKFKNTHCLIPLTAAVLLAHHSAHAASASWTGGAADGSKWATPGNWSTSPVPGTGDTATFNAAAGTSGPIIDLGSSVTVNTVAFASSNVAAYTIGAGTANSQSLVLNGSGNAGLSGSNTGGANTNQITINAALTINNTQQWVLSNGANPWIINGNVTPNGAAGSTIQIKINGRNVTFNGVISDQSSGAKLQISGANASTATLTNPNNSFTGGLYFDNGGVSINSIGMIGSNSSAGAGGDLLFGTGFGSGSLTFTGAGNFTTDRVIKFNNGYHGASINQSGASGFLKWTSNLDVSNLGGQTLALSGSSSGAGEFAGVIADNGTTGSTKVKGATVASISAVLYSVDGIEPGASISGTGITAGTTITAINSGTRTITLSQTASLADAATVTIPGVVNNTKLTKSGTGTWTLSGNNTYSGTTTVSAGSLVVNGGMKFVVYNSSNNKVTGAGSATFNSPFTIDTSAVTNAVGTWTLVDVTTKSYGGSFALTGFSGPVGNVYTKTVGTQIWTFDKSTGVLTLSSKALISSFGIAGATGVIDQNNKTIALTVPYTPWALGGLASLAPTFTVTTGTCNQTSGSAPSPTFASANPVTYTVTDGATVNNYAVTVSIVSPSTACAMLTCDFGSLGPATINEAAGTVILSVSPSQPVTALAPTFTFSTNATISPASGTTRDFTNPVVYRVTAENGTTYKDYTISILAYNTWTYSGSLFIITTPEGANLPGSTSVSNFPVLIRFNSSNFNFAQAQADGSDIRFATAGGVALSYEIEQWDSVGGNAAVWVKIPTITGNARQEIKMYWGKSGVGSQSSGSGVFNSSNGYCCVMHLTGNVQDSTGSTSPVNGGATPSTAVIGSTAMNLSSGDITAANIPNFPTGTNPTSTGQVWFRAREITNWSMPLAWGNKNAYGWNTWQMQIGFWGSSVILPSPLTCRGPVALSGTTALNSEQWYHLVYTNSGGTAKLYVNGVLDSTTSGGSLTIANPQALSLGMANGDADVDEARISNVARSADWVKLEYENQKPVQTLVGGLVTSGSNFSVSPTSVTMNENSSTTLTAQAGGAQKVYWIYKKNGQETLLATDQLTFNYNVNRITGNDSAIIQFKAVFVGGTQTIDVPLTVVDTVPDPTFTLTPSTSTWDGRQTMTVTANITNLAAMQAAGFGTVNYNWSVSGVAVAKTASSNTLTLTRAQGSGPMTVTLTADNGGTPVSVSTTIAVQEPVSDAWAQRTPDANEKPVTGQFFARDPNTGNGTIYYNGTQSGTPDTVYLKVYKTPSGGSETLHATHRQSLVSGAYAFSAPIPAGLITYRVVYGTTTGGVDTDVATVNDLVCGDSYIIEGQSNALAVDSLPSELTTDNFVRTYAWTTNTWGLATRNGNDFRLGYWGMDLALSLRSKWNIPICIITGAVGGTRIDQHQPNPAGHGLAGTGNVYSIYANLYNRVVNAKLTHGIRGVFWHQGESNSGADAGTGDWDYKSYKQYFVDMSAAWKQDFPNIQKYIIYQVQPKPCSMGPKGDQTREVQRNLPRLFSNMSILSTIGLDSNLGYIGCHYTAPGYQNIANLIAPLVGRDFYNEVPTASVTAPNLQRAYYTNSTRNQIALEFDQPTIWNDLSNAHFFLDKVGGKVSSGSHSGNVVTLQLASASSSSTIDYVEDQVSWDGIAAKLIYGANAIAALTFADVAIGPPPPDLSANAGTAQVALTWTSSAGATSYKVKRATSSGGPYTTIATTGTPSYTDTYCIGGTPYFYVVSAVNTVGSSSSEGLNSTQAAATPITQFAAWTNNISQGLTLGVNDGISADPDHDGIPNLLEFVFNSAPMSASPTALPTCTANGNQWLFEYDRSHASIPPATTQIIQYSDDLTNWTDITVPATSSGAVSVTPGSTTDHVTVTIPSLSNKTFVRLKASQ